MSNPNKSDINKSTGCLVLQQLPPAESLPLHSCGIHLGKGYVTIVDPELYRGLSKYRWYLKWSNSKPYAVRKIIRDGNEVLVRMHRQITHCPPNMIVHHKNRNSLDNHESNLVNLTHDDHAIIHNRRIYTQAPTPPNPPDSITSTTQTP